MNEFTFNGSYYYVTENLQNFTQAQKTCHRNSSEIANLKALNFEKFVEKIKKVPGFIYNNVLRVQPVNNSIENCFGAFDVSWINVDEGLAGNVRDICQGHRRFYEGMYKTLCSKPNEQPSFDSSSGPCSPLVVIIMALVVLMLVVALIVVVFYFKENKQTKLTQKSSVRQNELVESGKDVSSNYRLTI